MRVRKEANEQFVWKMNLGTSRYRKLLYKEVGKVKSGRVAKCNNHCQWEQIMYETWKENFVNLYNVHTEKWACPCVWRGR